MKKLLVSIAFIMIIAGFALANGSQESASVEKRLEIAFINKSYANPFFEYMRVAVIEQGEKEGFDVSYLAPTKPYNLEEQTRLMDDVIAKGVDGIVLVPVDSTGMVPAVERANQAGIPVAVVNTKLLGGEIVTFSAIENYDAMTSLMEYAVDKLGGKGKVILIEGTAGNQTATDRLQAQKDVIAKFPKIEVLASQAADFDRAKGMSVMENLIQTYPQIDAVFSGNAAMALGAIEALRAAGRLNGMIVTGFDMTPDAVKAIMDGDMYVTMDQNPEGQATKAVSELIKYINGESVSEYIKIDGVLIESSNVSDYNYVLEK